MLVISNMKAYYLFGSCNYHKKSVFANKTNNFCRVAFIVFIIQYFVLWNLDNNKIALKIALLEETYLKFSPCLMVYFLGYCNNIVI